MTTFAIIYVVGLVLYGLAMFALVVFSTFIELRQITPAEWFGIIAVTVLWPIVLAIQIIAGTVALYESYYWPWE